MELHRGIDGSGELRPAHRARTLGGGTLACPRCDAPVFLAGGPRSPGDAIGCPFCSETGRVRDFLTLGEPSRPARVEVRVVQRAPRG
jgi:hypothetical protein